MQFCGANFQQICLYYAKSPSWWLALVKNRLKRELNYLQEKNINKKTFGSQKILSNNMKILPLFESWHHFCSLSYLHTEEDLKKKLNCKKLQAKQIWDWSGFLPKINYKIIQTLFELVWAMSRIVTNNATLLNLSQFMILLVMIDWLILHFRKSCDNNKSIVLLGLVSILYWVNFCLQFCLDQVVIPLIV